MLKLFALRSKNAVAKRVAALVEGGLLQKDATGRIVPVRVQRPVRLLGVVQAGFPSPAEEETLDLMSLDDYLIANPQATFLVKVEGDSMVDAG
ncbi:MAG TPA: S24 family peptidase, partial [Spirochaetales bacterium]|nr:S24 family peptidase [Spirochaetales bacterium]